MSMIQGHVGSLGRKSKRIRNKKKKKVKSPKFTHIVIAHCNIGINEDLFNASFPSWIDAWMC